MRVDAKPREGCVVVYFPKASVANIQRKRQAKRGFQSREIARNVGEEQRTGIDQNGFGVGVRRGDNRSTCQKAVRKRLRHSVRLRRTRRCKMLGVFSNQLHLIADTLERNQRGAPHLAAVQAPFADALRDVVAKEK